MRITTLILTIITLFCCSITELKAQRYLPGMKGLQVQGGMVDGFYSSSKQNKTGYYFGTTLSTYTRNVNKWVFGAEFLNRNYSYKSDKIPVTQFTTEGGYYFNILSDPNKTFLFYFGTSALVGYETSNWGEKTLFDNATLQDKDTLIYGGAISFEMETYLSDRIILLINARERILWSNTTGHFHIQFGLGLKFIIN